MSDRDGRDEAHAIPACKCGHYATEHRPANPRPPRECWLCDCERLTVRKAAG